MDSFEVAQCCELIAEVGSDGGTTGATLGTPLCSSAEAYWGSCATGELVTTTQSGRPVGPTMFSGSANGLWPMTWSESNNVPIRPLQPWPDESLTTWPIPSSNW